MLLSKLRFLFIFLVSSQAICAEEITIIPAWLKEFPFESYKEPQYSSGQYYAVTCRETCELITASVSLSDEMIRTTEGAQNGKVLRIDKMENALFLIRGVPNLKSGKLKTWYHKKIRPDDELSNNNYELSVKVNSSVLVLNGVVKHLAETTTGLCEEDYPNCPKYPQVHWIYKHNGIEKTLYDLRGSELGSPFAIGKFVIWIGDLDGDNKPDLVLRPQNREEGIELELLLSTQLSTGKSWLPSAHFDWWNPEQHGC